MARGNAPDILEPALDNVAAVAYASRGPFVAALTAHIAASSRWV
jgi:hypothetical protein